MNNVSFGKLKFADEETRLLFKKGMSYTGFDYRKTNGKEINDAASVLEKINQLSGDEDVFLKYDKNNRNLSLYESSDTTIYRINDMFSNYLMKYIPRIGEAYETYKAHNKLDETLDQYV